MRKTKLLGWLFLFVACITSCGNKEEISNEAEFLQYIDGFTAGTISKHSSIIVRLSSPSDKFNSDEKESVLKNIFEFSPKIEGEAYWLDQYTIEFKPKNLLKNGQEYIATFHLSKIQTVADKKNNDFKFPFKVVRQLTTTLTEIPTYKENNDVEVTGSIYLSDRENPETIEKILSASGNGKQYKIELGAIVPRSLGCIVPFKISGIKAQNNDQTITLECKGKTIGCEEDDVKPIVIYGNKTFDLIDYQVINGENAHVELFFNQELPDQDFKSNIYFSDATPCTISKEHSIVKVYPTKNFTTVKELIITASIKGAKNETLSSTQSFNIQFKSLKPSIAFSNNGAILPTTNGTSLPFKAVNLHYVDVTVLKIRNQNIFQHLQVNNLNGQRELKRVAKPILTKTINLDEAGLDISQWQNYFIDLNELVKEEPDALYTIILSCKKSYSSYPCDSDETEEDDDDYDYSGVKSEWESDPDYDYSYSYYDDYYYDDEEGEYTYIGDNPCKNAYYKSSSRRAQTNILITDIGVIAKHGTNKSVQVIVTNLKSTEPINDAKVKFYSYQQELLGEATTNSDGFAEFTYAKERPIFVEVEKDNQKNYLKINDANALSFSSFDVSGERYEKGLKGFIYGERGVWRPGDTLNISLMIQDQNKTLPDNHPIVMTLFTPKNQKHTKTTQKYHTGSSIYSFRIPTEMEAPTGCWNINFQVGGATFSKRLNIETIKPNRLKIKLEAKEKTLHGGLKANFHLFSEWLHGGKASNMNADISLKLKKATTAFPNFKDYSFESPAANEFSDTERSIYNDKIDENGNAYFSALMPKIYSAPGMMTAILRTRVFEGEGDFSISSTNINYSPFDSYAGIKSPTAPNSRGIYYTDKNYKFDVVNVDENGNIARSNSKLYYRIYKISWRWWWDSRNDDNLAYYVNSKYANAFKSGVIELHGGKGALDVEISSSDWGRYLILVTNEDGHTTGCTALFDWESCVGRAKKDTPEGATMLTFTTDKMTYNVGEKIKLTIPTSNGGRALVSFENGSRIITSQWVQAQNGSSEATVEIEATPEMSPNAFINITLLQPHKTTANDLPIRLYGVQNINVQDKATVLKPKIEMSNEVASGKPFDIKISEENNQEMDYTLAIVDEGLLDITGFKTPNPYETFFKREALGVNTWDIYNQVIGAFGGRIEKLFGIGGDGAINAQEDEAQKRFKAVVKFIGPCKLAAGKKANHTIKLPNYYGSVRVMVVAGNGKAYGNAEKAVKATSPLMVLATLPRVAGPNEELTLPVNVFNNSDKTKNVKITVTAGDIISLNDNASKEASIDSRGDKVTTFKLKVANKIGKQRISIKASDSKDEASTDIWLEVRNPNPRLTTCQTSVIEPGKSINMDYNLVGIDGTNTLTLEASTIPAINLENRLQYLIGYPHGCAEQTTSKGFPQMFLPTLCQLTTQEIAECEINVKNTIKKLEQMQMSDGSVSYWMGGNYTYDWVNNYVGDFMITAQNRGYNVSSFLASWKTYQNKRAVEWRWRTYDYNSQKIAGDDFIQAYRLYTLAAYGAPAKGAMNRLKEEKDLSIRAKWRLAGAYALTGDKNTAKNIINGISTTNASDYQKHDYETFGSQLRDEAMVMEVLLLLGEKDQAYKLAQSIAKTLNTDRWLSTQETAYALIAISKLANGEQSKGIELTYNQNGKEETVKSLKSILKNNLDASKFGAGKVAVTNKSNSTIFVTLAQSGIPAEDKSPAKADGLQLSVTYYNANGETINVNELQQGTDFVAKANVKNTSSYENYNELSLIQIFPSGWEIINNRMNDNNDNRNSKFSYQDIRDDRVMTYFDLKYGETKTFYVNLHAAYAGRFFLPACSCEYMYDNTISARTQGEWVSVKK